MKRKKLTPREILDLVLFCILAAEFLYAGIFNLTDIIIWRKEITKELIFKGINLFTVYEVILHAACACIIIGAALLYKGMTIIIPFKKCSCGCRRRRFYKYCPVCGAQLD